MTRQEFEAAQRQMMLRSVLIAGLSGLMLVIVIAGIVTGNGPVAVIGLFWFVLIALVFGFAPGSAWRRNPVVQSGQRHSFDDNGADLSFGGRATRVDWGYFTQMVKGPAAYQLLRGKKFGLVVPRRAFLSGDDEQAFAELVRRHLPDRRHRPHGANLQPERPYGQPPDQPALSSRPPYGAYRSPRPVQRKVRADTKSPMAHQTTSTSAISPWSQTCPGSSRAK